MQPVSTTGAGGSRETAPQPVDRHPGARHGPPGRSTGLDGDDGQLPSGGPLLQRPGRRGGRGDLRRRHHRRDAAAGAGVPVAGGVASAERAQLDTASVLGTEYWLFEVRTKYQVPSTSSRPYRAEKINVALCPPNPNELDMTWRISASLASLGT